MNQQANGNGGFDWVANMLAQVKPISPRIAEKALASLLIEQASKNSAMLSVPIGLSFAAAFDLLVAAEYYQVVSNKGWLYCADDEPLLLYPFTNTCPRCVLGSRFHFHRSNKPESGSIGTTTSRLLCVFLEELFVQNQKRLRLYRGIEPVDIVIYDEQQRVVLLAEVKAAPLTTMPLAIQPTPELQASIVADELQSHVALDDPFPGNHDFHIVLPLSVENQRKYRLLNLGSKIDTGDGSSEWAYKQIARLFGNDEQLFRDYFNFWYRAFQVYNRAGRQGVLTIDPIYWLTNGCGQPSPRPKYWPRRPGTGYESVSDSKSSVGMDRTDDIKKGIYQVLKIGAASKPYSSYDVKTALISNIHAVRHYDEYLRDLQDIVWSLAPSNRDPLLPITAKDLPDNLPVYNLFDGIITFTRNYSRDAWIGSNFTF